GVFKQILQNAKRPSCGMAFLRSEARGCAVVREVNDRQQIKLSPTIGREFVCCESGLISE
ncbi:hypothetical protein, partial [Erwinia amylovora]|uniref:hypothetical protein n=1 Tax=Erwinia amylovora TaxID=552 RepID=UPI001963E252